MPAGRPTKYKPEFCEQIIEHMARGNSFESFAGRIGVCFDTVYRWAHEFPEFSESKKIGLAKLLLFDEELGKAGVAGQLKRLTRTTTDKLGNVVQEYEAATFGQSFHIFTLKNRYPRMYRDNIKIDMINHGAVEKTGQKIEAMMNDPEKAAAALLLADAISEEE